MIGSCLELIVTNENELKEADRIACQNHIGTMYIVPNLIQIAGVARSLSNGRYKIFIMVDHPKGNKYGMSKFNGTPTDFFLADGYDITLTPGRSLEDLNKEIKTIHSFIKTMINQHVEVCYTLNISMRKQEEIEECAKIFSKTPCSRIKTESMTTTQPTKSNLEVHKNTIATIRKYCTTPLSISGNITYNTYKELVPMNKIAISPEQFNNLQKQEVDSQKKQETEK